MSKQLRNDEDYKREVLDLYSYINSMCQENVHINVLLSCSDAALESLERIKVYRISSMAHGLAYVGENYEV